MMLVEEAVGEALLKYNDAPERYDPEQATLHTYLVMAAYRDFQNATSKERRHAQRQATLVGDDSAEIDVPDGRSELDNLLNRISVEEWWSLVESTFSEPADRQLVIMLANGVRATESYARVLGITGLPAEEQAREVKRAKDRVLKRLKRLGESHDGRT
jgi:DNA-directed RNA polymerase specialized sigma24 family protein